MRLGEAIWSALGLTALLGLVGGSGILCVFILVEVSVVWGAVAFIAWLFLNIVALILSNT